MKPLKYILLAGALFSSVESHAFITSKHAHKIGLRMDELHLEMTDAERVYVIEHFRLKLKGPSQLRDVTAAQVTNVLNPIRKEREAARKKAEEEAFRAARLNTAARQIQDGMREHLAYKEERAEYAERERIHQAELMIASGMFSEDRDEIRLGGIRTAARNILGKIEVYMDSVIPLCRDAYQAIKKGKLDPAEMPPHMGVYKEILARVVPDDRPWVKPKDIVMAQDEETIRATIEGVDEILAKEEYGRVARGIKRFNGLDPEANLADGMLAI